jgi:ribosomal protein S18 acetylase RimI-like enzyme
MSAPIIRPYQSADRAELHRIAADTAFFGAPIETYMEDRRLFLDVFYAYYTDTEPQRAWVADAGDGLAGFLTGCIDTVQQHRFARAQAFALVPRVLRGYYQVGPLARRYLLALLSAGLRGEFNSIDLNTYPAHLHINVDANWRGHGLGRRLIATYLDQLRDLGIAGVHLETTDQNVAACHLYEQLGFELIAQRRTRVWAHRLDQPVEMRAYGLKLVN